MKGFWFQLNIGLFLSLGVGFGLLQRNWSTFWGFFWVALFIAVLYLVSYMSDSRHRLSRLIGKSMLCAYSGLAWPAILAERER